MGEVIPFVRSDDEKMQEFLEDLQKNNLDSFVILWKPKDRIYDWNIQGHPMDLLAMTSRLKHFVHISIDAQEGIVAIPEGE